MKIERTPAALADREAIFDYIEADSPRAAVAVDQRIEAAVGRLVDCSESGRPGRVEGTRELVLTRTPEPTSNRDTTTNFSIRCELAPIPPTRGSARLSEKTAPVRG